MAGYTAFVAASVSQSLQNGRGELAAGEAALAGAERSADSASVGNVMIQLKRAEQDFTDARRRSSQDPALRVLGALPWSGSQVSASAHLGAIGADLSRAGEGAAVVALQVAALRKQYAGRPLTPDDLQTVLQQAQTIAASYKGSIKQIGEQLKVAHAERAQVTTTDLIPPLTHAYQEVDGALTQADTAFTRYQDVKAVLSDLLGVALSG
ncbi:MAG: hypothetical protein E6I56_12075 [Chloroflexi bacterium]|nr:MAG: hypothetical protein E6I56_12075 [Chloroflexota bacterium]